LEKTGFWEGAEMMLLRQKVAVPVEQGFINLFSEVSSEQSKMGVFFPKCDYLSSILASPL